METDSLNNEEITYTDEEKAEMINNGIEVSETINLKTSQYQRGDMSIGGDSLLSKESIMTFISQSVATSVTAVITPLTKKMQQTEELYK